MKYFSLFLLAFLVGVVVGWQATERAPLAHQAIPQQVQIGTGDLKVTHYPRLSDVKRAWGIQGHMDCRSIDDAPQERRTVQP